ncbi:MAG: hypothetical protein CM15mP33_04240 [Candidatus Neomarinimicrobiota bacterium]|nr:MAG: hypothetical protein CM15mP33_04240 [Candidatus Neomarinimicrobiota bacterium]
MHYTVLLLPIAVIFFPAISATFLGSEDFHKTLLYFVIPSSIIALSLGCKMHGKYNVYLYGIFGIATLLIAAFFGHDYFGENGEDYPYTFRSRNYCFIMDILKIKNYALNAVT